MNIQELINKLEEIKQKHGNIRVVLDDAYTKTTASMHIDWVGVTNGQGNYVHETVVRIS